MAEFPLEEYFRLMTSTERTETDNTTLPETNVSEQVVYIGTIPIPKSFPKSEVTETFPNSWEDFCREHVHSEEERWIDHRCNICRVISRTTPPWERNREIKESKMCLPNEQYAESFMALAQLVMLNEKFVTSDRKNRRFSIMVKRIFLNTTKDMTTDELEPYIVENYHLLLTDFHTLMFDTKEQAEEFIDKFDSIIRIAALSNLIG
jgi:hypothetical protein